MIDIILCTLAILCLILGVIGAIIPIIPGPALTWLGILFIYLSSFNTISAYYFLIISLIILVLMIMDFILPGFVAKKMGGSKMGTRGATIGMILGGISGFLPLAIFGSVIGVFIGELIHNYKDTSKLFKSTLSAFITFTLTTGIKLGFATYCLIFSVKQVILFIQNSNIF